MLLDDDGFLLPVCNRSWSAGDLAPPTSVAELPSAHNNFALLAAAGVGKTTTFQALAALEQDAVVVNVEPLTMEGLERKLLAAGERRSPTYLDGLDQAILHESRLLQWLENKLTTETARLVPWRLACRSAAWEALLGRVLQDVLPDFRVWRLLPLDRATAEQATA